MQFSRVVTLLVTFFAFGLLVSAAPVEEREIDKRDIISEVLSVVTELQTQVTLVVGQISLLSPVTATLLDIEPLVYQVEDIFAGVSTNLALLNLLGLKRGVDIDARQLDGLTSEIASVLGSVISSVTGVLGPLSGISGVTGLTSILNLPIQNVLVIVEGLVPGVLTLVASLLVTVTSLLSSLGLGGILGILAL